MPRPANGVPSLWMWAGSKIESEDEPAKWVADEETWDKAKKAAAKSYEPGASEFWPSVVSIYQKMGGIKKEDDKQVDRSLAAMPQVTDGIPADDRAIVDEIVKHPDMNASTFYNQLKSKGFKISAPSEADAGSLHPAQQRAGVQEAGNVPRGNIADNFTSFRFLEAVKTDSLVGPTKFKACLIQEGMGNLRDAFYYTREALEAAVPVFEGKKIYADHPSLEDEQSRPERSVRDILGHFENVHVVEGDGGQAMLCADLVIMPDDPFRWARALMRHAVEFAEKYPDKNFVGLSINASGDANEMPIEGLLESGKVPAAAVEKLKKAQADGVESVRIVTAITSAVSADLVTEPGANGKITDLLEGDKMGLDPKSDALAKKGAEAKKEAADHADEEQDIELIKKMIAKHMHGEEKPEGEEKEAKAKGEEEEGKRESEEGEAEGMKHAMEAYEYFAKERKMETEEAAKHAAEAVKCAMHLGKKHEAAKHEEDEKKHESKDELKKKESEDEDEKKKESEDEKKKESDVARLAGRVAFLERQIEERKAKDEIEKRLAASKLPRAATKAFKESMGEIKTIAEFEKLFGAFERAYKAGGEAGHGPLDLTIEKTSRFTESSASGEGTVGFGDCVKK